MFSYEFPMFSYDFLMFSNDFLMFSYNSWPESVGGGWGRGIAAQVCRGSGPGVGQVWDVLVQTWAKPRLNHSSIGENILSEFLFFS